MSRKNFNFTKLFRKSRGCLIFVTILILCLLKFGFNFFNFETVNVKILPVSEDLQVCPIPNLFDKYPKNAKLLTDLKCPESENLVSIENGTIHKLSSHGCTYKCISWKTDFEYQLSESKTLSHLQTVPCNYFIVSCHRNEQYVITAVKDENLINKYQSTLGNKTKPGDVIVIGIDSLSYQSFRYHLPKTFAAFHEELNGVSFTKFNTRGDGTTVNLQAFLTGTKDTETYETRKRIAGSRPVDDFDWIFKHYNANGYVTLWTEEMTEYGTFQYRLNGFERQPTDFYLRTALLAAEGRGYYKNFCFGNRPFHSEYFKFFNDFQKTYESIPKFSFVFFGTMSHDANKYISYMDRELSELIIDLRTSNPNALIALYSDHGHRFNSRLTIEGKYEERLPFFGLSLPRKMRNILPTLKANADILTSALDFHATLEDFIGLYKPSPRSRHMSLLRPLPVDRNCDDIESLPHWCSCLNWKNIANPNSDKKLVKVANVIASRISSYTDQDRKLCSNLKLNQILLAYRLDANKAVLKFKQSSDVDGFVADLSDKVKQTSFLYKMTLLLSPGNGQFEVTTWINDDQSKTTEENVGTFRPEEVSRVNRYAPWVKCLERRTAKYFKIPDIRKFCICNDVL